MVIFKNAWYHLTGNAIKPVDDVTYTSDELNFNNVKQVVKTLRYKLENESQYSAKAFYDKMVGYNVLDEKEIPFENFLPTDDSDGK